jgi:hypothetical protein
MHYRMIEQAAGLDTDFALLDQRRRIETTV